MPSPYTCRFSALVASLLYILNLSNTLALKDNAAAFTPNTTRADDACAAVVTTKTWQNAKDCVNSHPYNETLAWATTEGVLRTLPLNVFLALYAHSPNPSYQPSYDLKAAVQAIRDRKDFKSDHHFQTTLQYAFYPLNDAHASWTPLCYTRFVYRQPFYPVAYIDRKGVTRYAVGAVGSARDAGDEQYVFREILKINGKDPDIVLRKFAEKHVGRYKDPVTRLKAALMDSYWQASTGYGVLPGFFASRTRIPSKGVMEWTLSGKNKTDTPVVLQKEWKVVLPAEKFSSREEYWQKFCAKPSNSADVVLSMKPAAHAARRLVRRGRQGNKKKNKKHKKAKMFGHGSHSDSNGLASVFGLFKSSGKIRRVDVLRSKRTEPHAQVEKAAIRTPLPGTKLPGSGKQGYSALQADGKLGNPMFESFGLGFYLLPGDNSIGIIVSSTLGIDTSQEKLKWRTTLSKILAYVNENGVKKIILDMSGNGGGNICLAAELVSALAPVPGKPVSRQTFPWIKRPFYKDQPANPLVREIIKRVNERELYQNTFHPSTKRNPKTNEAFPADMSITTPVRHHPNLPEASTPKELNEFSHHFVDLCGPSDKNPIGDVKPISLNTATDLVVFTNGACGSSCAIVLFQLVEVFGVKTASTVIKAGEWVTPSGFAGGQVYSHEELRAVLRDVGLVPVRDDKNGIIVPSGFPVQAVMRFPFRAAYSSKEDAHLKPLEFTRIYADYQVPVTWDAMIRDDKLWVVCAKMADWIPGKEGIWPEGVSMGERPA